MFPAISISRAGAVAALFLSLLAPAASASIDHVSTQVTAADGSSFIAPGDSFSLVETLRNSGSQPASGMSGTLRSSTTGVVIGGGSPNIPTIGPNATGNTAPISVTLPSAIPCGAPVNFNLDLTNAPTASVPFAITTGSAGPQQSYAPTSGPVAIPDGAGLSDTPIEVTQAGRVKNLEVRIGSITHSYVGDLDIRLVAPDGVTSVTLINATQAPGSDFTNTVFADNAAQSVTAASAPYTGRFRPYESLSAFGGIAQAGTWHLIVADHAPGNRGTVNSLGLDVKPASCASVPEAGFSAAPSPVAAGAPVTFTNDSRDPTGRLATFVWNFADGGPPLVVDKNTRTVNHTFMGRGVHTVDLQMQDGAGAVLAEARSDILVDQLPVARLLAPADVRDTSVPVTLDAAASAHDPGGRIGRYEFDTGDGTFRDNLTSPQRTFNFTTSGSHVVRVRITDDVGATSIAQATVVVGNTAPIASFGAPTGWFAYGRAVTFDASGSSDPDGTVASYEWDFDGSGTWTAPAPTAEVTHVFPLDPGGSTPDRTYTVHLRVTDNQGATKETTQPVQLTAPPVIDVLAPSTLPTNVLRNAPVDFSVAGSGDVVSWAWDLDGTGSFDTAGGTTQRRAYPRIGLVPAQVRATDDHGVTTIAALPVNVQNAPPVARLSISPNPVVAGQPVAFDASASSDAEGPIANYVWDLDGDGSYETNTGARPTVMRTYANAGRLPIKVKVTDADGSGGVVTDTLVVAPVPAPPTDPGVTPPADPGTSPSGSPPPATGAAPIGGTDPGSAPTGPGGGGTSTTPTSSLTAGLTGASVQSLTAVLKKGMALVCQVDRAATCSITLTIQATDARRLRVANVRGKKPVVIATATLRATKAGSVNASVRLKASVVKRLRTARKLLVQGSGTARATSGATVKLARGFLLRK